jgi:hypothetical protein
MNYLKKNQIKLFQFKKSLKKNFFINPKQEMTTFQIKFVLVLLFLIRANKVLYRQKEFQ